MWSSSDSGPGWHIPSGGPTGTVHALITSRLHRTPDASRGLGQMKFLRRCLEGTPLRVSSDTDIESRVRNIRLGPRDCGAEAAEPPRYTLPLVRLDINVEDTAQRSDECDPSKKKGVTSALAGLTNQPAGDKICTLQVSPAFASSPSCAHTAPTGGYNGAAKLRRGRGVVRCPLRGAE